MKVKDKDVVDFIALEWREPQWEFDHPTVVLSPVVSYSPNGESSEKMIEDICISLCINADDETDMKDQDVSEEFKWRKWDFKTMKKVAKAKVAGKDDWKTKGAIVTCQKVKFTEKKGELHFDVIESKTY